MSTHRSCFLLLLFLAGSTNFAPAQPVLKFKHIDVNWPAVELYFSVLCDDFPSFSYHKENFRVKENGVPMDNYSISCPDTAVRCPISVSLVFDASGSMAANMGIPNDNAIESGHIFLEDFVDGSDQASIIWFNNKVTLALGMTSNKQRLNSCIDTLPAMGGTAMWDGLYAGLLQTQYNGTNECKAVVLLTDGGDNMSKRKIADVIDFVVAAKLKVFTIGLGNIYDSTYLKLIADTSGGRYYHTNDPVELRKIYRTISKLVSLGEVECKLTYTGECLDGGDRTVQMMLVDFCGGSDSASLTFHAPDNTGRTMSLHVTMPDTAVAGGGTFALNTALAEPLGNDLFYPFEAVVRFDPSLLTLKAVATQPGDLLYGVPTSIRPMAGGAAIRFEDSIRVTGNGRLCSLQFEAVNPYDTVCTNIVVEHWSFDAGCMIVTPPDSRVCIIPCHLQPSIAVPNNGVMCAGDSLALDAGGGYARYEWYRNGLLLGLSTQIIVVHDTGEYTARVTTAEWCSAESAPVLVRQYAWSDFSIGSSQTWYLTLDRELVIPFMVSPRLDPGTPLNYTLHVNYDSGIMTFEGLVAPDGSTWSDPVGSSGGDGMLTLQSQGLARDTLGQLFGLRFRSTRKNRDAVTRVLGITQSQVETRCTGPVRFLPPTVIAEGICDRVLDKLAPAPTLTAYPNPASSVIRAIISLPAARFATLRLCDATGKALRTVLASSLDAGETTAVVDMTHMKTGSYFLQLLTGDGIVTLPVVFIR